jgi:hypothetical protein
MSVRNPSVVAAAAPTGPPPLLPQRHRRSGFLFAFYRFSQAKDTPLFERLIQGVVRAVTSDIIHVAVVPVHECEFEVLAPATGTTEGKDIRAHTVVRRAVVASAAYTAFMWHRFKPQPVETVLTPAYEYLFLPIERREDMTKGMDFLSGLEGAEYNYSALLLTLLPSRVKRCPTDLPQWMTLEMPNDHTLPRGWHAPQYHVSTEGYYFEGGDEAHREMRLVGGQFAAEDNLKQDAPHPTFAGGVGGGGAKVHQRTDGRVFCSQMGLMLCQVCGALSREMDAATCTPGELDQLLWEEGGALHCPREAIVSIDTLTHGR